jgi:16S rRNA (guanine966-N2)-methyltransferase
MEFASRGAAQVTSVDRTQQCVFYLKDTARQHGLTQIQTFKADVFKYLDMETEQYDLIFADPPYDLNKIPEIPKIIFNKNLLKPGGMLIVEHQSMQNLSNHPAFVEQRKYGHSSFSFFKAAEEAVCSNLIFTTSLIYIVLAKRSDEAIIGKQVGYSAVHILDAS